MGQYNSRHVLKHVISYIYIYNIREFSNLYFDRIHAFLINKSDKVTIAENK